MCVNMPARRGHVAPQNTFLGIIIRKFEGQSKYVDVHVGDVVSDEGFYKVNDFKDKKKKMTENLFVLVISPF